MLPVNHIRPCNSIVSFADWPEFAQCFLCSFSQADSAMDRFFHGTDAEMRFSSEVGNVPLGWCIWRKNGVSPRIDSNLLRIEGVLGRDLAPICSLSICCCCCMSVSSVRESDMRDRWSERR